VASSVSNSTGRKGRNSQDEPRHKAQDHQPPFAGNVDLVNLVPLLPKNCQYVWEMSPRKTADEIRRSVVKWKRCFGE